jgi:predicted adenine nucleotide alpha hydrolase (AANH) superfamily ATPase
MTDLLLHTCCGPCSSVAVPAWRARGVEPIGWFHNPNLQPAAELERRLESMRRFGRAAALELVVPEGGEEAPAWRAWRGHLAAAAPEERCVVCLGLRLDATGAAARDLGFSRFSTTLSVSPCQRHDLIRAAGEAAADIHGIDFVYLDARDRFAESYAESRRLGLYRQPYCGCAASKWEAWHDRRERRRRRSA